MVVALLSREEGRKLAPTFDEFRSAVERANDAQVTFDRIESGVKFLVKTFDRAFDRIGSAITDAFVRGEGAAINFKSVARAVVSEIQQAFFELAIINPLKNLVFGDSPGFDLLPTLAGLLGGGDTTKPLAQQVASQQVVSAQVASQQVASSQTATMQAASVQIASAQIASMNTASLSVANSQVATMTVGVLNASGGGGGSTGLLGGIVQAISGFAGLGGGGGEFLDTGSVIPIPLRHGGRSPAGQSILVGEEGPEIRVPESSGTVLPNEFLRARSGPTVYINAPGADKAGLARLERMIVRIDGRLEARAISSVVNARRRNPRLFG